MIAYRPLDSALTSPIPEPPAPPALCIDDRGEPGVCVLDGLATIPAWRATLQMCNRDRARAAVLGATDGQE